MSNWKGSLTTSLHMKATRDEKRVLHLCSLDETVSSELSSQFSLWGGFLSNDTNVVRFPPNKWNRRFYLTTSTQEPLANMEAGRWLHDLSTMKATRQHNKKRALQYCSRRWVVACTDWTSWRFSLWRGFLSWTLYVVRFPSEAMGRVYLITSTQKPYNSKV